MATSVDGASAEEPARIGDSGLCAQIRIAPRDLATIKYPMLLKKTESSSSDTEFRTLLNQIGIDPIAT